MQLPHDDHSDGHSQVLPVAQPTGAPTPFWSSPSSTMRLARVSGAAPSQSAKKSGGKRRKPALNPALRSRTYYRRKEEKEQLEREIQGLNMQLHYLVRRDEYEHERDIVLQHVEQNREIRRSIRGQRIIFANTQSMISDFLQAQDHSTYEPVIRLGTDKLGRHETLLGMKPQRIEEGFHFLSERSRHMVLQREFSDLQRFQAANGDFCLVCFDVKPFRRAHSVRQVFDAVLQFTYNLEIGVSELLGDITIRENDDLNWDSTVAQHRLVTTVDDGVKVDTNNVTFAQYWGDGSGPRAPHTVGNEVGISVCNFVEEDALYPYSPDDRIRQDITFFVMVAAYPRHASSSSTTGRPGDLSSGATSPMSEAESVASAELEQEQEVVVTRWTCLRIREPTFPVDEDVRADIRDGTEKMGDGMFAAIRDAIGSRSAGGPL